MSAALPRLPSPLELVRHPDYFWPSRWSAMEACALSVWGESEATDLLPPAPEAVFGSVLHEARRKFRAEWDGHGPAKERAKKCFAAVLAEVEKELAASGFGDLVPLEKSVGWHRWQDRTKRLYSWTALQPPNPGKRGQLGPSSEYGATHGAAAQDRFGLGTEVVWQSAALRLRGRPDEAWRDDEGALCISDFKSGRVSDEASDVAEAIRMQLHLYALMAEALAPGTKVRLLVSGASDRELAWGEQERRDARDRLRAMNDAYPAEGCSKATSMAAPGSHCIGCRIRHQCSQYLKVAPAWWPNEPGNPRPLPWDVWGQVTSIRSSQQAWSLEVRDPAGRNVQVEGILRVRPLDQVALQDDLFIFGLQPAEDVRPHGQAVQPRNFFEIAPGPPWKSAVGARLFGPREFEGM